MLKDRMTLQKLTLRTWPDPSSAEIPAAPRHPGLPHIRRQHRPAARRGWRPAPVPLRGDGARCARLLGPRTLPDWTLTLDGGDVECPIHSEEVHQTLSHITGM